jgi:hypothetical protein
MNPAELLVNYIRTVRRCLRVQAAARGMALTLLCALALTLIAVPAAHWQRFTEEAVRWTRLALFGGTLAAAGLLLVIPLVRRRSDRRIARYIEERHPEYRDRLASAVELLESGRRADPDILALLLEDAHGTVSAAPASGYLDRRRVARSGALAAACIVVFAVLALVGPSMYRYGIGHLWTGWLSRAAGPLYQIAVTPGNAALARHADQAITARTLGFQAPDARLFAFFQSGTRWEALAMSVEPRGNAFQYAFHDVRENIRYYVEAAGVRSPQYRLSVADVARVQRIDLKYRFPAYTGLPERLEPDSGDMRAVKGTQVEFTVHTDIPADAGDLLLDSGRGIPLRASGDRRLTGTLVVEESGLYHVRLGRRGEARARASDDYVIDALPDQPPVVAIRRPGRDMRPTSIEEVTTEVEARDDFGLAGLQLHYAVNGGPERQVNLLERGGAKELEARSTLYLEEFKLAPGDVVAYYAVARDARQTAQTDIFFMEVRPFEREYRQAQSAGGMGGEQGEGGEGDESNLVQRQKEIIAATWNLLREQARARIGQARIGQAGDDIATLADIQKRLQQQTEMLATRMERRALAALNEEFTALAQNLRKAAEAMGPAAQQLGARKLREALAPEQKALQYLSRAEASYRQIQVAFGNSRSGGSRGRSGSARDLADLFDLELDTQKNQYETPQQQRQSGQRDEKLDAALRRLQELARRQQQLAEQRRRNQEMPAQSRWEQETLRRQTEELARELERLARQTGSRELDTIRQRLEQAARDMQAQSRGSQSGAQGRSGDPATRDRDRALQRLEEARDMLAQRRGEEGRQALDRLAEASRRLARDQRQAADAVRRVPSPSGDSQKRLEAVERALEEKSRVLDGLNNLERDIHQTARNLGAANPDTSRRLRGAGDGIRQEQLQEQIRQGADMLRRGLNQLAQQREESVRQGLEHLDRQLGDIRRGFSAQAGSAAGGDRRLERALARAEELRRRLEGAEERLRQQGQQARSGQQQGQPGAQADARAQQGQAAQGRQAGQQGGAGARNPQAGDAGQPDSGQPDSGQRGGRANYFGGRRESSGGMPEGAWNPGITRPWDSRAAAREPGPLTPEALRELEREYRQGLPLARDLERELRGDPDFARRARELVEALSKLDASRFPGDPAELERLRASILDGLRQVELELAHRLNPGPADLRLPPHEDIPDAYRRQVEQYYRSLAQRGKK